MPITVSPQWKQAVQGQFRLPAYLRADLLLVPPGIREGATATADDDAVIAVASQMIDGVSQIPEHVVTLEPGRWPGDGSSYLASADTSQNLETGWWSNLVDNPWSKLEFVFDKEYDIPGIHIIWDTLLKAHPDHISIEGFSAGGVSVANYFFDNLQKSSEFFNAPFNKVARIKMSVNGWSLEGQRTRVTEVTFGMAARFDNDNINSAQLLATADLLSGELPQLGLNFALSNYDRSFDPTLKTGYAKYLAQRQLVNLQWGFETSHKHIEWMDPWPLYLSSWDIPADSQTVTLSTTSRLSFLDQVYNRGTYSTTPRTLLSLAEEVLKNSDIIHNTLGEEPWELDPVLSTVYTRAPIPADAANVVLQLIANAAGCMLDNDPENNYIRIRQNGDPADYTIGTAQQLGDPSFKIIDRLKSIAIGLHTFSKKSTKEQVYSFQGRLTGRNELEIVFDQEAIVVDPTYAVSGASVVSWEVFARGAKMVVQANSTNALVSILVGGYIVDESITWIQTYLDSSVTSGLEITIDNPIVTEMETVQLLSKAVQNMYLRQVEATVPYLGYPELETGDAVKFSTNYGWLKGDLTSVSLDFNGGFTGQLKAKMLNVGALDRAGKADWYSGEIFCGEV